MNLRTLPVLPFVLLLGACAAQPSRTTPPAGGNGDRETAVLYERLGRAADRFAEGTRLLAAGDARGNP
ncbi:MAG: hypothetical protein U0S76_05985, partial [Pseudoxanthomonas sp.]|nr:hypothetical protein [Pseudoxanthomonas sp.]